MRITNYGFNLVGVIVATGIGVIVMAALTSQIISSSRQVRFLEAKMESLNLKHEVTLLMTNSNGANCNLTFESKSLTFTNTATDQTIPILANGVTTIAGTPLENLVNSYTANNRHINVTEVKLFHPANKMGNPSTPNTSSPYEFQIRIVVQEKSPNWGRTISIEGPTLSLNITGTTVDTPNACVINTGANTLKLFTGTGCGACPYGSYSRSLGTLSYSYCYMKDENGTPKSHASMTQNLDNFCNSTVSGSSYDKDFAFPSF